MKRAKSTAKAWMVCWGGVAAAAVAYGIVSSQPVRVGAADAPGAGGGAAGAHAAAAAAAAGQGSATGKPAEAIATKDISLEQAHAVLAAAAKKAQEINTRMDIAVVDAGGNLKAFARMDGAWLGSIDISIKKARTARLFDMPTGEIGKLSQPGGPLYNIEHSNGGLITFPGGVPIKLADGSIIGAIGVSGSSVENDHAVAVAGAGGVK